MLQNPYSKKSITCLIICVIFILATLIIGGIHAFLHNEKNTYKKIQHVFIEREDECAKLQAQLTDSIIKLNNTILFEKFCNQTFQKKDFIFVRYNNSKLDFWSDNLFPLPATPDSFFNKKVIFTGNAYFSVFITQSDSTVFVILNLIKHQYNFENNEIHNYFHKEYGYTKNIELSLNKGKYNILDRNKNFCFSIKQTGDAVFCESIEWLLFALFLGTYITLLMLLYYLYNAFFNPLKTTTIIALIADILIVRIALHFFHLPHLLYNLNLFADKTVLWKNISTSPGDWCLSIITIFIIVWLIYKEKQTFRIKTPASKKTKSLLLILLCAIVIIVGGLYIGSIHLLINLFSPALDLHNILQTTTTGFLLLFCLSINTLTIILIGIILKRCYYPVFFPAKNAEQEFSLTQLLFITIVFALCSGITYNHWFTTREHQLRIELADKLSRDKDPVAENSFKQIQKQIYADTAIKNYLHSPNPKDEWLRNYVQTTYFTGYWEAFQMQLTICKPTQNLLVGNNMVEVNCIKYFSEIINSIGLPTSCPYFYLLNYNIEYSSYLAVFKFFKDSETPVNIYIELGAKFVSSGLGYPELLKDKQSQMINVPLQYSYALYYCGDLIRQNGKYSYPLHDYSYMHYENDTSVYFMEKDKYSHLIFPLNNGNTLLISKAKTPKIALFSAFSCLFAAYLIISLLFVLLLVNSSKKRTLKFRNRLQLVIISIVLGSFALIGFTSLLYISSLGRQKNLQILKDKTYSVMLNLELDFANTPPWKVAAYPYFSDKLLFLANIYFSDIHFFSPQGELIASSRPQVFSERLISRKINPEVFKEFFLNYRNFYITYEFIGNSGYLSAYIPLRNTHNELLGFVNLPYFAKQDEAKQEMSDFIASYINIYVLFLVIAIIISIILSRYLTNPLKILSQKLSDLVIGKKNQHISLSRDDEIGELINVYNKMVDELEHNANLLLQSERRGAWTEMAKQVAHEIKNPLTPMKLNVQQLEKAWKDQSDDFDIRLKRFSTSMIEQINTLSDIATSFADFAQLSGNHKQHVDVVSILKNVITTFDNKENIKFTSRFYIPEAIVFANENQLVRAFNNLVKNAIQAIGDDKNGYIEIEINRQINNFVILISDNGCGIAETMFTKIFEPNFTSKTGGTGLGLAIAKSIIEDIDGKIEVSSALNIGTTFYVTLPKHKETAV